jgi:clan AA aspartic protease
MRHGFVSRRKALFPVTFLLPGQPELTLEFVVDTGFSEFLTLPLAAVIAMQLPFLYPQDAGLADGSIIRIPVHSATILWNDQERAVRVVATGRRPLLGMALPDDQELRVRFRENDLVTVDEL